MGIVEEINKRNIEQYGEIQPCCNLFKYFCKCSKEDFLDIIKKEINEKDNDIKKPKKLD